MSTSTVRASSQLDPLRERLFAITTEAGLDHEEAGNALRALTSYVLGFTLVTTPGERRIRYGSSPAAFEYGLSLLMDSLRARHTAKG